MARRVIGGHLARACGGRLSSLIGASGGTASRRSAPPTMPENTGAATSPP